MPAPKFFYGPCAAVGDELLAECCRRLGGPKQTFIYVVPTARRARNLEKQFLQVRPEGFFRPHLYTFHSMVELLYRRMGGTGVPISQSVKAMLLEEIVANDDLLMYFQTGRKPFPGLIRKLSGFISDLKQNLITPEKFEQKNRLIEGHMSLKSRELGSIYAAYQQKLADHQLIDTDGMFWLVLEQLSQQGQLQQILGDVDLLIFDGFFDVTTAEGEVLKELLAQANEVWLRLDYVPGKKAYAAADQFVQNFCSDAEKIEFPPPAELAAAVVPEVFEPDPHPAGTSAGVSIIECRDRQAEVEAIAAEIKQLAAQGVDPSKIGVAFKAAHTYFPIIREVFTSCGIPFTCSTGMPLIGSPVTATLLSLLSIVQQNYSRQAVLTLLRSPYVRYRFELEGQGYELEGDFLDIQARKARIFRERESWSEKLAALIKEYEQELEELENSEEEPEPEKLKRRQDELANLRRQQCGLELALSELARFEQPMTPPEFAETLHELIKRFGIAEGIFIHQQDERGLIDDTEAQLLERDYRALNAFEQVIKDVTFAAGYSERTAFELSDYVEMLQAGLEGETYDVRKDTDYGVQVLPVSEVRGGQYEAIFLGGMVDGEFPLPESPQIFYSEKRRADLGFKTTPSNLEIERYLFATVAAAPGSRLTVSYPLADGGKMLLKSLFLRKLADAVPQAHKRQYLAGDLIFSAKSLQTVLASGLAGRDANVAEQRRELVRKISATDQNVAMLRGLSIEEMRRRGVLWSRFEGMLHSREIIERVAEKFSRRMFSASALEQYARCPFRFFAERALRLAELEEPEEEMDALERGSLVHKILGRFYMERRRNGRLKIESTEKEEALRHLLRVGEEEFNKMPFEGLFWQMERERYLGSPNRLSRCVLEMFIDHEIEANGGAVPTYFEVPFGRPFGDDLTDTALQLREVRIEGDPSVRIIGRIDRVEVAECDGERYALAVDYKTGKPPHAKEVQNFLSLQIPIYMMALQNSKLIPVGGAYYSLKDNPKEFGRSAFFGDGNILKEHFGVGPKTKNGMLTDPEEFLADCREKIVQYVSAIREGEFHPSELERLDAKCKYCALNGTCRRDEPKVVRVREAMKNEGEENNG